MAIGSEGEIGVEFTQWGKMDEPSRQAWFRFMREHWSGDLMGGYAKVVHPDPDLRRRYAEGSWWPVA